MADDDVVVAKKKRTLLEKYEIPVNHLSFEYVEKCNNGKELERIVKILRSGEEGLYPDLVRHAEQRLKEILPESRVLRVEEPVLTKTMLEPEYWNKVNNELESITDGFHRWVQRKKSQEWSCEMKSREQELGTATESLITVDVPAIRSASSKSCENSLPKEERKRIKSSLPRDYSEWDKYDADKEILKMDLEDEKRREEIERKEVLDNRDTKVAQLPRTKTVGGAGDYSCAEKHFLAGQEKDRGNEYFKGHEYERAVDHYSASIAIHPTPVAYNNRAMDNKVVLKKKFKRQWPYSPTHFKTSAQPLYVVPDLKLENYLEALMDCNHVLEQEPDNVKALHRRGLAHKQRGSFQKALDDFTRVVQLEPGNRLASSLAKDMQAKLDTKKKSVRMHITEDDYEQQQACIEELSSDEEYKPEPCIRDPTMTVNRSWPAPPPGKVPCTGYGFAKVMCNCSGVPDWVRQPPPKCLVCEEIKARRRAEAEEGKGDAPAEEGGLCEHGASETTSVSSPAGKRRRGQPTPPASAPAPGSTPAPARVQVAPKYSTRVTSKGEEEATPAVQAIKGLSLEDPARSTQPVSPFELVTALQAVRGDSDPGRLAPILQRVDPADLPRLIGNKLDDAMLTAILGCLEISFAHNASLVTKFLQGLANLPRFKIVKSFLEPHTKQVVARLLAGLSEQGCPAPVELQQAYQL